MPASERVFLDAYGFLGDWGEIDSYRSGNPDFPDERAGSNDSGVQFRGTNRPPNSKSSQVRKRE